MKIALAMERFGRHAGGAESYAVELAGTLISEGWEVYLYGYEWDGEPQGAIFHPIPRLSRWIPPSIRILHFAFSHRRMIAGEHFDVVLGFGNTLTMNVYQSHGGVHYLSNLRKLQAVRNPLLRSAKAMALLVTPKYHARAWIESAAFRMRQHPVIIAISDMVRQDMADYFRVDKQSIRLVYNGIDHSRFVTPGKGSRDEVRRKLGFGNREVLFLFMAYDFRKKGVRYLVEAAARLREKVEPGSFGVAVVGNHPSPPLSTLVRKLKLDGVVVFPGPTRQPEAFYAACDAFILPTFYDACSLVVFEAMAAGLPVISTVFNGASGVITEGIDGAVLKDPRDINEMAGTMERFLDRKLLESASSAARETASRYTLEDNHRKMLEILNAVQRRESERR